VAFEHGFLPDTVWKDPANADLRQKRSDMNVLHPGDTLVIPDKRLKEVSVPADKRHRFRRLGVPEKLRVQFLDLYGDPIANEKFVVTVDGDLRIEGQLDGDGRLEADVPPNAKEAVVEVGPDGKLAQATLAIGHLDPAEEPSGVEHRLRNLGFYSEPPKLAAEEHLPEALRAFQRAHGLEVTGEVDDATRSKLLSLHGS
jgi:N-acetylmuramoyl-L-alanine amidase